MRLTGLDADQRSAVDKVLAAEDYCLILGMPGTGKTTTIARIIETLVAQGKSVLLTSYTHSAVDNILLKLLEAAGPQTTKVDFIRLGNTDRVHPTIRPYTDMAQPATTVHDLARLYETRPVVATTCLGINHPLFVKRRFDYCIVDEASQVTLPVCLGPLRYANVFVLVGDHYQLPPLVRNIEARDNGFDISLFRQLSEAHPSATVTLQHQYRMNEELMVLANVLTYGGRLQCGNARIATSRLCLPALDAVLVAMHAPVPLDPMRAGLPTPVVCTGSDRACWLAAALAPSRPLVFLDTDRLGVEETKKGELIVNEAEATLTTLVIGALLQAGLAEDTIGVISPYRSQLNLLTERLATYPNIEILTVDKFQGRQKPCVIMSFVRCNSKGNVGDLLRDWRRINVAVTRAELKLIMVGSMTTLGSSALFRQLFDVLKSQNAIVHLPLGSLHAHPALLGHRAGAASASSSGMSPRPPLTPSAADLPRPLRRHALVTNLFENIV